MKEWENVSPLDALGTLCSSVELPYTNRIKSSLQRNMYFLSVVNAKHARHKTVNAIHV